MSFASPTKAGENMQYGYRMRAFNSTGTSAYTAVLAAKTLKKRI